ncbi:curved DNA-binding protein [Vigna unguiculata]|uniref:Curved DNA-binding protein n=1 Tax=Vigna unguiculata TaxID=3917 RepID=A0A4D6LTM3_VIGUN|nr:curved DNA-binding protein [Vigna unguiculata]
MVYLAGAGHNTVVGMDNRRPKFSTSISPNSIISTLYDVSSLCRGCREHDFSSASESAWTDFPVENAYELLGVSETSSFTEIKASFRKLAKETHPDLAESSNDSSASRRFVQILAAYEILSDSQKRAHYDMYLLSQKKLMQKHSEQGSKLYIYKSQATAFKEMEVVEWLKWYRLTINNILSEKRVVDGTGYFDVLERDFYSAIHAAYYGPEIDSMPMEFLPDCFEAEERSSYETPEVLHLVSGRDLFGMVCLANKVPEISTINNEMLTSFRSFHSGSCQSITNVNVYSNAERSDDFETYQGLSPKTSGIVSDAYRHLELHISGRVVATASRTLPRSCSDVMQTEDTEDHIQVFLNLYEDPKHIISDFWKGYLANGTVGRRIHLGTISGLGSSPDEGCCYVYNDKGTKTHAIMKHRTLMVKHMHWYQVGEKVSVCECRCTRAHLPPSKFWLFEPRCGFHDIGGWYVETYGKDKHGRTKPSQRFWDGLDYNMQADRRLHPAMYLFALAYRTLDLEYAKASKKSFRHVVGAQMFRVIHWCKKLVQ